MKRHEDEDSKSKSPSFQFPIGMYLICLCGVGIYLALGTPAKTPIRAFVSIAVEAPVTLATTFAASAQQVARFRD